MKLVLILIIACFSFTFAQQKPEFLGDKGLADEYFKYGNFEFALEELLILHAKKPNKLEYRYQLGVCYNNTFRNKKKAIEHLEFVVNGGEYEEKALFELGIAYHQNHMFDKAIAMYERFSKETQKDSVIVDKFIKFSLNAKEMMKFPLSVTFENMGKAVNSEMKDYLPYVAANEAEVVFTTKRIGTSGRYFDFDGQTVSDVFTSKAKLNGGWRRAKGISPFINTENPEELAGISRNNMHLIYSTNNFGTQDLSICSKAQAKDRSFSKPVKLSSVNTSNSEAAAAITNDGEFLVFSSTRPGGYGGSDLYISKRLPNRKWGEAINLGPEVNTPFNDNYPSFSSEDNVLYFASEGHTSMGGYDLFKTSFDKWTNRWKVPENLGYPLNTVYDDYSISFNDNGKYAYVAQYRGDSYGDYDIYRVDFLEKDRKLTVINGLIKSDVALEKLSDSLKTQVKRLEAHVKKMALLDSSARRDSLIALKQLEIKATNKRIDYYAPVTLNDIRVYDKKTNELYGSYKPNQKSGRYVIILPPGIYQLKIKNVGFEDYEETYNIQSRVYYKPEIARDIHLTPHPEYIKYTGK